MGDSESLVDHEIRTSPTYQPAALDVPMTVGVTSGGVASLGETPLITRTRTQRASRCRRPRRVAALPRLPRHQATLRLQARRLRLRASRAQPRPRMPTRRPPRTPRRRQRRATKLPTPRRARARRMTPENCRPSGTGTRRTTAKSSASPRGLLSCASHLPNLFFALSPAPLTATTALTARPSGKTRATTGRRTGPTLSSKRRKRRVCSALNNSRPRDSLRAHSLTTLSECCATM